MVSDSSDIISQVFQFGTRVIVGYGPFEGLPATVLGVDEDRRLIVIVTLERGLVPLTLDSTAVHAHNAPPAMPFAVH